MSNYYADQLLASNYNGVEARVQSVSKIDGGVTVVIDGKSVTTTENYLDGFFHEVGTRIPTINL